MNSTVPHFFCLTGRFNLGNHTRRFTDCAILGRPTMAV